MPLPSTRVIPIGWSTHHRPAAAGGATATCELRPLPGPAVYDEATGSSTAPANPSVWAGACRVQADAGQANTADQGGQEVTRRGYLVQLVETGVPVPDVAEGWTVTVIQADDDAHLVGRVLTVTDVRYGSLRFMRDLICDDNLG